MEFELLKIIYDYSVRGKLVDSKFIEKIIEIVVNNRDLNNYVTNIMVTNKLEKDYDGVTCATYGPFTKTITLDYESISVVLENRSIYDSLFNPLEQIMFKNLLVTQFILHELEHAYQNKQSENKQDNTVETRLIRASLFLYNALKNPRVLEEILNGGVSYQEFKMYLADKRAMYNQYYLIDPSERLAQVKSYQTIISILNSISKHVPNLYEFTNATLVEESLRGYADYWSIGCPSKAYLLGTKRANIWSNFDFYDPNAVQLAKNVAEKYNLAERLSLGLPISEKEFISTNSWLQTTNKFSF